jgi:hypothetical protein
MRWQKRAYNLIVYETDDPIDKPPFHSLHRMKTRNPVGGKGVYYGDFAHACEGQEQVASIVT